MFCYYQLVLEYIHVFPPPPTQARIWEGPMTWPRFPAAEVTSVDELLLHMCSSFAWTTVFMETWSRSTALRLCSLLDWVWRAWGEPSQRVRHTFGQSGCPRPRLLFNPLICTTWAGQDKPDTSQTQQTYLLMHTLMLGGPHTRLPGKSPSTGT